MLQKDTWKGRFSIQFHRTWKLLVLGYTRQILSTLLIKQVKRCWFKISDVWEKSNFRQSRSLIFPSYPIARVRWCYTRSELITVCNFHSGSMVLSLDWKLWIWIWLWIGICVKAAESLRNSFSQLIFIL